MLSTTLDLAGLACLVAGVLLLLGPGAALLAGGGAFLFLGLAADGVQPLPAARRRLVALRVAYATKKRSGK